MGELAVGLLYLSLHNQLVKKFGVNGIVSRKEIFTKLGKHNMIPKNLRPMALREMQEKGLIEKIDRDKVKILRCEIDLEKDSGKLYKLAGVY